MKQEFPDQRLDAVFSKLAVSESQKLNCPQGYEIKHVCINPQCENALICDQESCVSCMNEVHPLCPLFLFLSMKKLLNKKAKQHKEFLTNIFELENNFMHQIHVNRSKLIQKYEYNFVGMNYRELLSGVFDKAFTGKKAQQLQDYVTTDPKEIDEKSQQWTKQYQSYLEGVQTQMAKCNQMFFEAFSEQKPFIDSRILRQKSKMQDAQIEFLEQSLGKFTKIELLFRGSEYEFSAKCLHAKCDNEQNTLTLVKTQQGKTVAGFTETKWALDGFSTSNAFLLQLDNMQKFVPKPGSQTTKYFPIRGPVFGTGGSNYDLRIGDKCHITCNSYSNFPSQFNLETGDQLEKNDQNCQTFIGANNGQWILVEEYEVFKVIYE